MEVARLRGLQERVADRQSEVDEMRARRWQVGCNLAAAKRHRGSLRCARWEERVCCGGVVG